ncbi:fimbrial protein [Erwinia mallotivora]|uniref:fimbrial protein n=1 Tax=Erwinia mallotivora TaxID=69222 RepID=UPI00136403AB|nr:fimbrial protein [Erwinia mallotivora]
MLNKKILSPLILLAGTGFSCLSSANDDGTIHFTGTISAAACSVDSVAGTSGHYGTVDFGVVSSKTLSAVNNATSPVPFAIALTDCAVSSAPTITFNGESVAATGGNLFATPVAGVGIRIEDAAAPTTIYRPGIAAANSGLNALNVAEGSDPIPSATAAFRAYLVRASGTAPVTGSIDSDVTFTINYTES